VAIVAIELEQRLIKERIEMERRMAADLERRMTVELERRLVEDRRQAE
jgi:hypothetical protein